MINFVRRERRDKLKHTGHKTSIYLKSSNTDDCCHDTTIPVETKYDFEYGRFKFVATKRFAGILGATMFVVYLALCVGSVFFWTWLIEKFI